MFRVSSHDSPHCFFTDVDPRASRRSRWLQTTLQPNAQIGRVSAGAAATSRKQMPGRWSERISQRDLEVLEFIARQGVVSREAMAVWAVTAARGRAGLSAAGDRQQRPDRSLHASGPSRRLPPGASDPKALAGEPRPLLRHRDRYRSAVFRSPEAFECVGTLSEVWPHQRASQTSR